MTEERQPDEVLRVIACPELDQYHDYPVHELWLGGFNITSGTKEHCDACAAGLRTELSKAAEQQLAAARAQVAEKAKFIQDKCEQYWNEPNICDAEIHAALEWIHSHASAIERAAEGQKDGNP